jgi:CheY-like chemotaxis protein
MDTEKNITPIPAAPATPAIQATVASTTTTTSAAGTTPAVAVPKKQNIFIIDDDKFFLDTYALKFTKNGYAVTYAFSGDEALKKLHDGFTPDILLVDNIMPGLTGLDLIATIRKENIVSNATIIMLTNQNAPGDIDVARNLKVDGYIIKAMAVPSEVVNEVEKIYAKRIVK